MVGMIFELHFPLRLWLCVLTKKKHFHDSLWLVSPHTLEFYPPSSRLLVSLSPIVGLWMMLLNSCHVTLTWVSFILLYSVESVPYYYLEDNGTVNTLSMLDTI